MSDKNTLLIDGETQGIDFSIQKNSEQGFENFKLLLDATVTKLKSVFFAFIGLLVFGGLWSLLSVYTKNELPTPTATLKV